MAVLLVAVAVAAGTWFVATAIERPDKRPQSATVLPETRPLPRFALIDHENRPFTRESLLGRTSLVFFGFTHCPDICPATLQQLASARRQIAESADDAAGPVPQIILISVDPERDTPAKLEGYVEYFGEGITGVTGPIEEIRRLTGALGIHFEKSGAGDDYTVNHSSAVLVIGPDGMLRALFSAPHKVESFVHDVPILMASR